MRRHRLFMAACAAIALASVALAAPSGELRTMMRNLQRALEAGDTPAACTVIRDIGYEGSEDAVELLLRLGGEPTVAFDVHEAARDALATVTNPEGVAALADVLSNRRAGWELKLLAAEALVGKDGEGVLDALCEAATSERSPEILRRAAARALAGHRAVEAVDALIECLAVGEAERGLLWEEARQALYRLTGEAYETAAEWRNFWSGARAGFSFEERAGSEEGTRTRARPTFFGREVDSSRVVFIIDTSGSMVMWDADAEHPETPEARRAHPPQERVRIERAKAELIRVIQGLDSCVRFNIIAFSSGVRHWQEQLVPADDRAKRQAVEFVSNFRADGGTATDDALRAAFRIQEADTFYLLSDGAPMKYGVESRDEALRGEILQMAQEENRFRRVRIFCLGFAGDGIWPEVEGPRPQSLPLGQSAALEGFMQDLAAQNDGVYEAIE